MTARDWYVREPMPYETLIAIAAQLEQARTDDVADLNLLYLHLSDMEFSRGLPENGIASLKKIKTDRLLNSFQYSLPFFINTYSLEMTAQAVANLMLHGETELTGDLVEVFQLEVNRSSIYGFASQLISLQKENERVAVQLIDSARTEMLRLDNPSVFQPNRLILATALMYQNPGDNREGAYEIIKNSGNKNQAIRFFAKSNGFHQEFYEGLRHLPDLASSSDRLDFYYSIMRGYHMNREIDPEWETFYNNQFIFIRRFLPYIPESS